MRRRLLLFAVGVVCCLPSFSAFAADPAEQETPALPARWEFDFREGKFDHQKLVPVGALTLHAWTLFSPEPRGLRISIPWHQGKTKRTLGVAAAYTIYGDFQLTADCELVTADIPKEPVSVGGQIYIATQKSYNGASILRGVTPEGRHVYSLYWAVSDQTGRNPEFRNVPADSRTVKLRFVRTGETLHLQAAEGENQQFRELADVKFGKEPVGAFQIESITNGAPSTAETLWSRMEIRAEKLKPVVIPLHAAGHKAAPADSKEGPSSKLPQR